MKYLVGLILCLISFTSFGQNQLTIEDIDVSKYKVIKYHEDGSIAELGGHHWWSKKRHGDWYTLARDGKVLQEGHFKNGKKDGVWRTWSLMNGSLVARYEFDKGERVGDWFFINHETSQLLSYRAY